MQNQNIDTWAKVLAQAGQSPSTVRGYRWDVEQLARWLADCYGVAAVDWQAIGYDDLIEYLHQRLEHGVSGAARKHAVSAFKSFFKWLYDSPENPAKRLKYPKVTRKKQRWLRPDAIVQVLAACDTTTATGLRDLALMALAFEVGLRSAELCRLRLADVSLSARMLTVQIKGGQIGTAWFGDECALHLANWLAARAQTVAAVETRTGKPVVCETLFCSIHHAAPLTTDGLRGVFRYIAARAGLEGGFSPHDLRRSFAQALNAQNAPDRTAMAAGRWTSAEVYRGYVQDVDGDHIRQFSPLAYAMRLPTPTRPG